MAETATPHDAVFKTFLSRVETARDFIEIHLPSSLIHICKLDTLHLESGSFIEDSLRPYYSDVLYSLETTCGRGYVHILIEHQSSPDKHMAFRLMRYAVAAMHQHLEKGHKTLPLVIPILFYQGRRSPYPWSLNWLEAFSDPDIARQLYSTPFPLVDITVIPDDEIMQHRSMAALTLIQKHIRQRDMAQLLDKLTVLLMLEQMSRQQVITLINYIAQAGEAQDVQTLLFGLAQRVPQHGETLMTFAEHMKQIGLAEGIQKGMQDGKRTAMLDIARAMLQRGFNSSTVIEITGLSKEELQQLPH
ncbi:Rpn family recombination-promoting nuclease/putative transposase [Pseudescherichia sp.]|uniref:Rpn family recombination-promoting nuclease/putative transposase n=1 Tax=Pseudescherichia sp. TaxID=2055881 RepID=UPI0028A65317|nr:Rpn family recombination-promoting nuclease/putative transposase [Pseudescherichia sp.]